MDIQNQAPLYEHRPRPHFVLNANEVRAAEVATKRELSGAYNKVRAFNTWLALKSTVVLGSMWCFYAFLLLSFTGFPGLPWVSCTPQAFVAWLSSQTIQLAALPLLGAGQIVLSKHQEAQADEAFKATINTLHDSEQMMEHLNAQDAELLRQSQMLLEQGALIQQLLQHLTSESTPS